jgi:hypothetical protein
MVNLHTTTHAMRAGQRYKSQHILFHYSATKHRLQVAIDTCSTQKFPTRICTHCSPIRSIQLAAFKALVGPRRTAVQGMAAPHSHHNHALLFTCVVFFVLAVEVEKARTSKPKIALYTCSLDCKQPHRPQSAPGAYAKSFSKVPQAAETLPPNRIQPPTGGEWHVCCQKDCHGMHTYI